MQTKYLLTHASAPGGHEKEAGYAYFELTPEILGELIARRAIWQRTAEADSDLGELVFRSFYCHWLRRVDLPEDKDRNLDANQWCWLDEPLPAEDLEDSFGENSAVLRTELDEMVIWESGMFFRSVERHSDVLVESQVIGWADLGVDDPIAVAAGVDAPGR